MQPTGLQESPSIPFLKLLKDLGCAASSYPAHVRNLRVRRVQADEIWAFVYGKDQNLTLEQVKAGGGSVWTWTVIDADKLDLQPGAAVPTRYCSFAYSARACFSTGTSGSALSQSAKKSW